MRPRQRALWALAGGHQEEHREHGAPRAPPPAALPPDWQEPVT